MRASKCLPIVPFATVWQDCWEAGVLLMTKGSKKHIIFIKVWGFVGLERGGQVWGLLWHSTSGGSC